MGLRIFVRAPGCPVRPACVRLKMQSHPVGLAIPLKFTRSIYPDGFYRLHGGCQTLCISCARGRQHESKNDQGRTKNEKCV